MESDEEISSKIHDAIVEEIEVPKKRMRLSIDGFEAAFITRKVWPRVLKIGDKLEVIISYHAPTERWLVSDIISIEGEPYEAPKSAPLKEKTSTETQKEPNKNPKKKSGLPFSTTTFGKKDWTNNIAQIIKKKTGSEDAKKYWEDTATILIENFNFTETPIMNGEMFQGFFVKLDGARSLDGWQGSIWCEKLNELVYVRHNQGRILGSIGSRGEQVEFQVVIGSDNKGNTQFVALNWSSTFKRHFSEPAYSVTADEYTPHKSSIAEYIQQKVGPVVIVALPTKSSQQIKRVKKLSVELQEDYTVNDFYWPKPVSQIIPKYNLGSQTKEENSHPYIGEFVRNSMVLRHPDFKDIPLTKQEEKHIILGITKQAHISQIEKRKEHWLILGDETGNLGEWIGPGGYRPSRMMWIAIPPDETPSILSPEFHGQDYEQFNDELNDALKELESNRKIKKFIFTYESGKIPSQLKEEKSKSPHLMMWNNTLPLVIERLLPSIGDDNIEVFIERVYPLSPGSRPLAAPMQDIANNLSKRPESSSIEFIDHRILSKYPLEHGWLGYTDAIGHLYNDDIPDHMVETISNLQNQCISVPYRQDAIESIRSLILKAPNPLQFLTSLSDIEVPNQEDYIDNFLKGTIVNSLNNLKSGEWQELLEHIKSTAKNYQGQKASRRILSFAESDSILKVLRNDSDRFDFLMSILGTAGHIGATNQALDCIERLENMLESGLEKKLSSNRQLDFLNLKGGTLNNLFDFSHIQPIESLEFDSTKSQSYISYIGSQAVARALRGQKEALISAKKPDNFEDMSVKQLQDIAISRGIKKKGVGWPTSCPPTGMKSDIISAITNKSSADVQTSDWQEAWSLERALFKQTTNEQDLKRRSLYRAELRMDNGQFSDALQELENISKEEDLSETFDELRTDAYFLATLLKSCVLSGASSINFPQYTKSIVATLTSDHPSQRIAYWYIRWACTLDNTDSSIVRKCCEHLIGLMEEPLFTHDAAGVILACELLDLKSRGLIDEDVESFMESVLSNSAETTREWVAKHPPNEDDWLAPLNFNYR